LRRGGGHGPRAESANALAPVAARWPFDFSRLAGGICVGFDLEGSMRRSWVLAAVVGLALTAGGARADFAAGARAYSSGDYATALAELTPLAEAGDAVAAYYLGEMDALGLGVPQDSHLAVLWYMLAAAQDDAKAQYRLGMMYTFGDGVLQDYAEAARWLRLAADQGNSDAQRVLGKKYWFGEGVPQDYAEAARWFRRAAARGDAEAQLVLGSMYENGEGVLQDYITAHMWFNIAAANGSKSAPGHISLNIAATSGSEITPASRMRDAIAATMSSAEISEAQRQAKECLASNYTRCDN